MARIAFVGARPDGPGHGRRSARRRARGRRRNRTPGRDADLVARGCRPGRRPRTPPPDADAVVVMVSDDEASRSVWLGPDGLLAGARLPGRSPSTARRCPTTGCSSWRTAGRHGLRFLDCPVTGLPDAAAAGELTLLVGADGDLAAAQPLLEPMSKARAALRPGRHRQRLQAGHQPHGRGADRRGRRAAGDRGEGRPRPRAGRGRGGDQPGGQPAGRAQHPPDGGGEPPDDVVFSGRLRRRTPPTAWRSPTASATQPAFGRVALARLDELLAAGLGEVNESAVIEIARGAPPGR